MGWNRWNSPTLMLHQTLVMGIETVCPWGISNLQPSNTADSPRRFYTL
jgi:hypothetical protein